MSKTEASSILDTRNVVSMGDKVEKGAKPCPNSVLRRKLADISNLPQRPGLVIQDQKAQSVSATTKEYIEQLQKENMALKKILAQRNKIIEQSGIELDKLRVNLLKMQEQNQQLAVSNTQMLLELNSGKDRLKALQHELGCKNGLLRALEYEEKARMRTCENVDTKEEASSKDASADVKPQDTKRTLRSNSLCSLEQVQSKEKAENKRPFVRRQSARFKSTEPIPAEDSSERDAAAFPECHLTDDCESVPVTESISEEGECSREVRDDDKLRGSKRSLLSSSCGRSDHVQLKEKTANKRPFPRRQSARFKVTEQKTVDDSFSRDEDKFPECPVPEGKALEIPSVTGNASIKTEESSGSSGFSQESQQFGRSSLGRPSRQAAKKVQSYKEIPVNIKMRRSE